MFIKIVLLDLIFKLLLWSQFMEFNSQTKTFSYQFVCSLSISEVQSMFEYLVVEIFEIENFKKCREAKMSQKGGRSRKVTSHVRNCIPRLFKDSWGSIKKKTVLTSQLCRGTWCLNLAFLQILAQILNQHYEVNKRS